MCTARATAHCTNRAHQVTAEILKREGVGILFTYPLNPLTESAAALDIRPLVVRQERVGCATADALGAPPTSTKRYQPSTRWSATRSSCSACCSSR